MTDREIFLTKVLEILKPTYLSTITLIKILVKYDFSRDWFMDKPIQEKLTAREMLLADLIDGLSLNYETIPTIMNLTAIYYIRRNNEQNSTMSK